MKQQHTVLEVDRPYNSVSLFSVWVRDPQGLENYKRKIANVQLNMGKKECNGYPVNVRVKNKVMLLCNSNPAQQITLDEAK